MASLVAKRDTSERGQAATWAALAALDPDVHRTVSMRLSWSALAYATAYTQAAIFRVRSTPSSGLCPERTRSPSTIRSGHRSARIER